MEEVPLVDDVVEQIVGYILRPMIENAVRPDACVYAYFSLCLTSKQFRRACETKVHGEVDWFRLLGNPHGNYGFLRYLREEIPPSSEALQMIKTLTYYDSGLPVIRKEIDRFMGRNQIIYRTRGIGKPYKGYVGIRKLKTIKVKPVKVAQRFKELCTRYEETNKQRLLMRRKIEKYADAVRLRHRKEIEPLIWPVLRLK